DAQRPGFAEVRFHQLGTPPASDPVVHPATGSAETFIGGRISRDGHWLVVEIMHGWDLSDIYLKDLRHKRASEQDWVPLVEGIDARFDIELWRDHFYITTNEGAPRRRVLKVDPKHPERAAWREIVKESDATLEHISIVGEHLVLTY